MQRNIVIIVPVIAVLAGAVLLTFIFMNSGAIRPAGTSDTAATRVMSVEDYMANNISTISPIKEQVGGKFQVTHIKADNGTGVVTYSDGHNEYTADFTYTSNETSGITITSFIVHQ
ncbi:MAG: hypothetical protein JO019_02860 [Candidatus Kaiserbacteria bacterium]|nr:hypothetical protein [Candidatus Kaiserbacteria bacterium]